MKFGSLQESLDTYDTGFLREFRSEDLSEAKSVKEIKNISNQIFESANEFAEVNKIDKYFDLAQKPLWESIEVEPEEFIFKGFNAKLCYDMEKLEPYVVVQNNNISNLKEGQIFTVSEVVNDLNELQQQIFNEALDTIEERAVDKLKKVWNVEKERIEKWIKFTEVKI